MDTEKRRPFNRIFKFSTKLIIALSAANLVISCLTGLITYRIHLSLFNEEISRQYDMTTEQILARLDSRVNDMYRITDYITLNPTVQEAITTQSEHSSDLERLQLERMLDKQIYQTRLDAPELMGIRIYDLKGNRISLGSFSGAFYRMKPEYLEGMIEKLEGTAGEYVWSWPGASDMGQAENNNMVLAGRLMRSVDLDTYGLMLILFSTSLFESHLKDLRVNDDVNAYLFDQEGKLLYSLNGQDEQAPDDLPAMASESNLIRTEQGITYMYTKQRSEKAGFTLVSKVSLAQIQDKSRVIMNIAIASALASLIFVGLITTVISRMLLRPLGGLVKGMKHVREGKFETRVRISTKDELGYLGDSFNNMTENIEKLIYEVYERKLSEKEAELKAIQAQLNPHFLYNTLSMFFWKFYMLGDEKTANLVNNLSGMLQYTLEPVQHQTTLRDEINQIRNYLQIQMARYQEALHTEIDIDEMLLDCRVFRLLIQPIVENSFVHAFQNKKTDRRVTIKGYVRSADGDSDSGNESACLILEISDNGSGMTQDTIDLILQKTEATNDKRRFIGTRSVIRRIELVYGPPYGVEFESKLGEGTLVRLILPYQRQESDEQ